MTPSKFLPCVTALVLSALAVRGELVLVVDITDLSAVTVTAVNNNSLSDDTTTTSFDGVTLWGFFSGNVIYADVLTGTFKPTGDTAVYNNTVSDNYSTGSSSVDLNFYADPGAGAQNFSTTQAPFTGTGTFDLSGILASLLPTYGASGSVHSGWSGAQGEQLGEYTVVPEPAPLACVALAFGLFMVAVRARGSRRLRQA